MNIIGLRRVQVKEFTLQRGGIDKLNEFLEKHDGEIIALEYGTSSVCTSVLVIYHGVRGKE